MSARGIKEGTLWGKKLGQLAVVLLVVVFVGFGLFMLSTDVGPSTGNGVPVVFMVFALVLILVQFCLPAYLGVRYLARLPVKEVIYSEDSFEAESVSEVTAYEHTTGSTSVQKKQRRPSTIWCFRYLRSAYCRSIGQHFYY